MSRISAPSKFQMGQGFPPHQSAKVLAEVHRSLDHHPVPRMTSAVSTLDKAAFVAH